MATLGDRDVMCEATLPETSDIDAMPLMPGINMSGYAAYTARSTIMLVGHPVGQGAFGATILPEGFQTDTGFLPLR